MFERFELESEFGPKMVDGSLIRTLKHETVNGAYTYEFIVRQGNIIFSVMRGKLQEVHYQFKTILPWVKSKYRTTLLEAYATDGRWRLVHEDKTGKMFYSEGERFYAGVGKGLSYLNFGSMAFHEEKFRVVS